MMRMPRRSRFLASLVALLACRHAPPEKLHIVDQKVSETGAFAAIVTASEQTHGFELDRLSDVGRIEWRHPIDCSTINGVDVSGDRIVMRCASPTSDRIVGVDAKDGREVWRYDEEVESPRTDGRLVLSGDAVVSFGGDRFTVLALANGKLRLSYASDLGEPWLLNRHAFGIGDGKVIDVDLSTGEQTATQVAGEGCVAGDRYLEHSGSKLTQRPVASLRADPSTLIETLPAGADRLRRCATYESDFLLEFTTDAPNRATRLIRVDKTGRIVFDRSLDGVVPVDRAELDLPRAALPRWTIVATHDDHDSYFAKIDLDDGRIVAKRPEHLDDSAVFLSEGTWLVTTSTSLVEYPRATGKPGAMVRFTSPRAIKRIGPAMVGGRRRWVLGDGWTTPDSIDLLVLDEGLRPLFSSGITLKAL